MAQLPKAFKTFVLVFYESCKAEFSPQYPFLFRKGNGSGKTSTTVWFEALDEMAGKVSDYERIAEVPLFVALFSLNRTVEKHEKLKSKTPQK